MPLLITRVLPLGKKMKSGVIRRFWDQLQEGKHSNVFRWDESGQYVLILDIQKFHKLRSISANKREWDFVTYLPRYFEFEFEWSEDRTVGVYHHPNFRRDRPELLDKIRMKIRSGAVFAPLSPKWNTLTSRAARTAKAAHSGLEERLA